MDYVTCGTGSYFDFYPIIPVSLFEQQLGVPFAAALKRVVKHAVVQAESHIRTPAAAEAVIAAGQADMVSIVRGQIADPHLVAKARADRADEIRPCISCNQLCWGRRSRDYWISCLGTRRPAGSGGPATSRRRAASPRTVLVVGGGPAGLEAARVAAERGHRVTLAERPEQLGGQFRLAGRQPSRSQVTDLIAWFGRRLEALGVDVRLGSEMGADDIAARGGGRGRPGDRLAPARARGSSARCRWSIDCRAPTATTRSRSRTSSTSARRWASEWSCSMTSATGAAWGRRCTSPSAATK